MGDHHHGEVRTGIRKYFKEDYHFAMGILGFYFSIFLVVKVWPSKKVKDVVVEVTNNSGGEIPSIESPEFADWISVPGNIEKLVA